MDFMSIVTNRITLVLAAVFAWTLAVHKLSYNAGHDKAEARCQSAVVAAQDEAIRKGNAKLHAQAILYELQIEEAQAEAYRERRRRESLDESVRAIRNNPAPDCTAIPDEWLRAVEDSWDFGTG